MPRLKMVLVISNHISKISPSIGENLLGLTDLILTNNRISSISEIDNIATLKKIENLSLLDNPVTYAIPQYRLYVVNKIPTLKSLDFKKVTTQERADAAKFFKTSSGKSIIVSVAEEKKIAAAAASAESDASGSATASAAVTAAPSSKVLVLTEDQKRQVRVAIQAASTKEDIDLIERQLKTGTFAFTEA